MGLGPFGLSLPEPPPPCTLVDGDIVDVDDERAPWACGRAQVKLRGFIHNAYGVPSVQVEFLDEPGTHWWVWISACTLVNAEGPGA